MLFYSDVYKSFAFRLLLFAFSSPPKSCFLHNHPGVSVICTLCGIAAGSVLHQDVVERLVGPVGQLVDSHGGDPLQAHGALWVPAVDHAVISRPEGIKQDEENDQRVSTGVSLSYWTSQEQR